MSNLHIQIGQTWTVWLPFVDPMIKETLIRFDGKYTEIGRKCGNDEKNVN